MLFSDYNYPVIYKITNCINNKIYVGKAINFANRYKYYKYNHKYGRMYIYRAMNKYGFDNFIFELLEECNTESLIERENYWILKLESNIKTKGYNLRIDSKENSGWSHTEATKKLISSKCKGKSAWHKGLTNLPCYRSEEALQEFSKRMTGGNNPNAKKVYQYDTNLNFIKEYDSASTAAKELEIVFQGICRCATGERKSYKSYIWSYSPLH